MVAAALKAAVPRQPAGHCCGGPASSSAAIVTASGGTEEAGSLMTGGARLTCADTSSTDPISARTAPGLAPISYLSERL